MSFITYILPGLNVLLYVALAALLVLRGAVRHYPLLLLYSCLQLTVSVADAVAISTAGVESVLYRKVYWTGDVLYDMLLFLLVITLTYQVMEGNPMRPGVGRILAIIAVAAAALPFVLYHPYFTGRWFRHTSQLLGLGAAFMNLLLWTGILAKKGRRDHQLLMVSVGLGIAVTGTAVSYGLLQFMSSNAVRWLPDLFKALAQVGGNAIWCWAFLPAPAGRRTGHPLVEAH